MSEVSASALEADFIAWQCRVRQYAVREDGGRPSTGMRPELIAGGHSAGNINVQLVRTHSETVTREFRHLARKTQDPNERYAAAVKLLSEYYYRSPEEFDGELTAVFSLSSELARRVVELRDCTLVFAQGGREYTLQCTARSLAPQHAKYQATYWHNLLFNPALPGRVTILGLRPDWRRSRYTQSGAPGPYSSAPTP